MQWDATFNGGFCAPSVSPWLPLASDSSVVNVAQQRDSTDSIVTLYQQLVALRRSNAALSIGSYRTACMCVSLTSSCLRDAQRQLVGVSTL